MCVNDIVVQGAEPLFFLDYFATGRLDPAQGAAIVKGIAAACVESGCALIGGETAEMPGIYARAISTSRASRWAPPSAGRCCRSRASSAGDVVFGLPSSGLHSNGFSLVRRIVAASGLALGRAGAVRAAAQTLAEALLTPTRLYVKPLLAALKAAGIRALAHITGGGFPDNLPRVLPDDLAVAARPRRLRAAAGVRLAGVGGAGRRGGDAAHLQLRLRHGRVRAPRRGGRGGAGAAAAGLAPRRDRPAAPRDGAAGRHRRAAGAVTRRIADRRADLRARLQHGGVDRGGEGARLSRRDPRRYLRRADAAGLAAAREAGIEALALDAAKAGFEAALDDALRARGIELVCLAGFMRVLSADFVRRWRALNIHPSLLPAYKGLRTHARALADGVREHGCTVIGSRRKWIAARSSRRRASRSGRATTARR